MRFRVIWMPPALDQLAKVWTAAADRNAVADVSHDIDVVLAAAPNSVGVAAFDTVREFIHEPLGVEFEVDELNDRVFVLTVWDTATGRPAVSGN